MDLKRMVMFFTFPIRFSVILTGGTVTMQQIIDCFVPDRNRSTVTSVFSDDLSPFFIFMVVSFREIIYEERKKFRSSSLYCGVIIILSTPATIRRSLFSRLNYFLALSRTPHALLDLAAPGLAALLCLGTFPSSVIILVGFVTALSGYTAVYALNDIVDYQVDRKTCQVHTAGTTLQDLDSLFVRHPLAQGLIGYREALLWALCWAAIAILGAWWLNPFCLVIFIVAALLEIIYCSLLRITWLRSIVSGFVKTSGPVAAVFAVNPEPPSLFLLTLFLWFFFWEIGGQNVPNDLSDLDADRDLQARTIPIRFGIRSATLIIGISLIIASSLGIVLTFLLPGEFNWFFLAGAVICGLYFLIIPAMGLYHSQNTQKAFQLFNRASYYPLALLSIFTLSLLF